MKQLSLTDRLRALQERFKKTQGMESKITLELSTYVNDILAPNDPPGEFGILNPRFIHKELAERLAAHPLIDTVAVIEDLNGEFRLWRIQDWKGQYKVYEAQREINIADSIRHIEEREAFQRAFAALTRKKKGFADNPTLCKETLQMWISDARDGDAMAIEFLASLDYYKPEEE